MDPATAQDLAQQLAWMETTLAEMQTTFPLAYALQGGDGQQIASGGTAVAAGLTGLAHLRAQQGAELARNRDEPDQASAYRERVDDTAPRAQRTTVGLRTTAAGLGLTTTLTVRSVGKAKTYEQRVVEFDAARRAPRTVAPVAPTPAGDSPWLRQ